MIPGSTPRGCLFKFVSLRKFKLAQHKWQKEEQALLYKIIGYFEAYTGKLAPRAGRSFQKDYIRKARREKSSGLLSSVENIGAATLTPRSKKDLGTVKRIGSCSEQSWIATAKRNGRRSNRNFRAGHRMPLRIDIICCWTNKRGRRLLKRNKTSFCRT